MPSSLTQIRVLELEPLQDPVLGLLCLLSEPRDCARGSAPAVEPTEQAGAAAEQEEAQVEGEVVVVVAAAAAVGEEVAAAEAAAAPGTRLDGSFTSRKEQSSSTRRENWT